MNVIGSKHLTQDNRYRILSLLQQNLPLIQIANDLQKDPRAISREIRNHRVKTEKDFQFNTRNEKYTSPCKRCSRFPFVCDGCPTTQYCMYLVKFHYKPESAHRLAQRMLRDARMGLNVDPLHFQKLDQKIYEVVSKGQSLNHIFMHSDEFEISLRSAYRYVELGLFYYPLLILTSAAKSASANGKRPKRNGSLSTPKSGKTAFIPTIFELIPKTCT